MIETIGLESGLDRLDSQSRLDLPGSARDQIGAWLELLAKWNLTYNLTAIREPERMVTHHVLDALAVLPHLPASTPLRLLDIGSGAGVPGLLFAIARPRWDVVLIECNHKRAAFLQQAVVELGLANVETATVRVEDYSPSALFDVVVSRAFSDLATLARAGMRHVAPGGRLVAMKGVYPHEELADLPQNVRVVATKSLLVPGVNAERHLIIMQPVA